MAYARRPERSEDRDAIRVVYASTRADELAQVPWTDEQKAAFCAQQEHAQRTHYDTHFAAARREVVEVDGRVVGRLYVHHDADEVLLIDVALLPEHRGDGIGTELVRSVLAEGAARGVRVTAHVELFNRARTLYERLGFTEVSRDDVYALMAAYPKAAS